jgi:hypothetical protein
MTITLFITREARVRQNKRGNLYRFSELGIEVPLRDLNWKGIIWHHKDLDELKKSYSEFFSESDFVEMAKIKFSDVFAASTSRSLSEETKRTHLKEKLHSSEKLRYVLWNGEEIKTELIDTKASLTDLIKDINSGDISFITDKYLSRFKKCPEDKMPLLNLTSLQTHNRLVSQFYRLLDKDGSRLFIKNGKLDIEGVKIEIEGMKNIKDENKPSTVDRVQKVWFLYFIRFRLGLLFKPVRAKDLNVVSRKYELINNLSRDEALKDHILFYTNDDIWFVAITKEQKNQIIEEGKKFFEHNILVECRIAQSNIKELKSPDPDIIKKDYEIKNLYPTDSSNELPAEIKGALICEVCQFRKAEYIFRDYFRDNVIEENICSICNEHRNGVQFKKITKWEKEEKDSSIAWIKISLDYEKLEDVLKALFDEHLQYLSSGLIDDETMKEVKENFRYVALLADFTDDYHILLNEFKTKLIERFQKNIEFAPFEKNDFFVVRYETDREIIEIIDEFCSLVEVKFKKCLKESPIRLDLCLSKIKYPFFEAWRFLEVPKEKPINVFSVGHFDLNLVFFFLWKTQRA